MEIRRAGVTPGSFFVAGDIARCGREQVVVGFRALVLHPKPYRCARPHREHCYGGATEVSLVLEARVGARKAVPPSLATRVA